MHTCPCPNKAKVEARLEEEIAQRRKVEQELEIQRRELKSNAQELAKVQSMLVSESSKNEKVNGDLMVAKVHTQLYHRDLYDHTSLCVQAEVASMNQRAEQNKQYSS